MPREALRKSHISITLNDRSASMEKRIITAIKVVRERIEKDYGIVNEWHKEIKLDALISSLNKDFGTANDIAFTKSTSKPSPSLKPDGGFIFVDDNEGHKRCILVAEAKRQGTNADRLAQGLPRQAQGNAIERLRKNMQGFDALFSGEKITPFVCFGEGCDFENESSILDRVSTMNSFFPLNTIHVDKIYVTVPAVEIFKPTSLFFREESWSPEEMIEVLWPVCTHAIEHYEARYGLLLRTTP